MNNLLAEEYERVNRLILLAVTRSVRPLSMIELCDYRQDMQWLLERKDALDAADNKRPANVEMSLFKVHLPGAETPTPT